MATYTVEFSAKRMPTFAFPGIVANSEGEALREGSQRLRNCGEFPSYYRASVRQEVPEHQEVTHVFY